MNIQINKISSIYFLLENVHFFLKNTAPKFFLGLHTRGCCSTPTTRQEGFPLSGTHKVTVLEQLQQGSSNTSSRQFITVLRVGGYYLCEFIIVLCLGWTLMVT